MNRTRTSTIAALAIAALAIPAISVAQSDDSMEKRAMTILPASADADAFRLDTRAASDMLTAYHRAKVYWVDRSAYPKLPKLVAQMRMDEPNMRIVRKSSRSVKTAPAKGTVGIWTDGKQTVVITVRSMSGRIAHITDVGNARPPRTNTGDACRPGTTWNASTWRCVTSGK